jgi:hypothetical protein
MGLAGLVDGLNGPIDGVAFLFFLNLLIEVGICPAYVNLDLRKRRSGGRLSACLQSFSAFCKNYDYSSGGLLMLCLIMSRQ